MTQLKLKIFGTEVEYEGSEGFLRTQIPQLIDSLAKSHNEEMKRALFETLADLERSHQEMALCVEAMGQLQENFTQQVNALGEGPELPMSFNLQYLQLQQQLEIENRRYTALSNVIKTKHDTVKNSISNIR